MIEKKWVVYLVQCSDKSLYCGITNNLKKRLAAHNSGRGAKYTRSRRPVRLLSVSPKLTKSDALRLEYGVKQVPAGEKQNELAKGQDTLTIKAMAEVRAIKKQLKVFSMRVENIRKLTEKIEKRNLSG
jgi:putative endonuclease